MSLGLKQAALAAVAALTFGSAAQASEVNITIRTDTYGTHRRVADQDYQPFKRNQYTRSEGWYEHRDPNRYYGRPVPEWQERRFRHGGYYGVPVAQRPHWQQPVFAGPSWGYPDTCKIIIKERVNRWGETVQVRTKVCR